MKACRTDSNSKPAAEVPEIGARFQSRPDCRAHLYERVVKG